MNNFAISSAGIGQALLNSASALYTAGNTIDESIALITAANSVVQNPASVGTALKTLSLRIRGAKVELQEAGEDVDGMADSVSSLREKLLALTGGKVDVMLDKDTFKNTTQILGEVSKVWSKMSDINKAATLELLGGKRQANILSAIITNYDMVEDVIKKSTESSGSALKENEKYLNSIQGRIDQFNNSLQTMWTNFLDDEVIKSAVNFGTLLINGLNKIGPLWTVVSGSIVTGILKIIGSGILEWFDKLGDDAKASIGLLEAISKSFGNTKKAIVAAGESLGIFVKTAKGIRPGTFGWIAIAIAAFSTIAIVVKKFHKTTAELIEDWEQQKSKVNSINEELKTTQDRIAEINSHGILTIADEAELKTLREINDELERRKRIEQRNLDTSEGRARTRLKNDFNKEFNSGANYNAVITDRDRNRYGYLNSGIDAINAFMQSPDLNVFDNLTDYQKEFLQNELPNVYKQLQDNTWSSLESTTRDVIVDVYNKFTQELQGLDFVVDGGLVSGSEYIDQNIQKIKELKEEIYETNGEAKENLDDEYVVEVQTNIDELESNLAAVGTTLYGYLDKYGAEIDDDFTKIINSMLDKIDIQLNPGDFYNKKFDEIFGKYSPEKTRLYELAKQGQLTEEVLNGADYSKFIAEMKSVGIEAKDVVTYINSLAQEDLNKVLDPSFSFSDYSASIDNIQENLSAYKSALDNLESGNFTFSDFVDLIQKFPELAEGVDTSTDSFEGLVNNLRKAIKNSPKNLIKDLKNLREQLKSAGKDTTAIDQLIDSMENLPDEVVKNLAKHYGTLADQIYRANTNQNKLADSLNSDSNEGYKTRLEVYEEIGKLFEIGAVGSESKIWDIAEAFFGDNPDALAVIANKDSDALWELYKVRQKIYEKTDDGEYSFSGIETFIKDVASQTKVLEDFGATWTYVDGVWNFDLPNDKWEEFAHAIGMSTDEFSDLMMQAGQFFNIKWTNINDITQQFNSILNSTTSIKGKMSELSGVFENLGVNINDFESITAQDLLKLDFINNIDEANVLLSVLKDAYSKYQELQDALNSNPLELALNDPEKLVKQLNDLNIDATWDGSNITIANLPKLEQVLHDNGYTPENISQIFAVMFGEVNNDKIIDFTNSIENINAIKGACQESADALEALGIRANYVSGNWGGAITIDSSDIDEALGKLGYAEGRIDEIKQQWEDNGIIINVDADTQEAETGVFDIPIAEDQTFTVTISNYADVINDLDTIDNKQIGNKEYSVIQTVKTMFGGIGFGEANGNAHVGGTAFSSGSWGAKKNEKALTGELGTELIVRGNRWFTVGENGAEFTDVHKGDIIFNHKQTKSLLENGYVTSRGKAFAEGTAYASGGGRRKTYTLNGIENSGSGSGSDSSDDSKQVIDFIEYKIKEIENIISKTTAQITNFLDDTSQTLKKNQQYDSLVNAEKDKAKTYLDAAELYNKKATELLKEIPEEFRSMAKNGAIAITDFIGEDETKIAEAIEEYREWAQKSDDAEAGYLEAIAQIAAYRVEQLKDIADDFENIIGIVDSHSSLLQAEMDYITESGERLSENYYKELISDTNKKIEDLNNEKKELKNILDDAVASGDVQVGTDEWYEMVNAINDVDIAIVECRTEIEGFENDINDLRWDNFEKFIKELDNVNSQISHLYEILSDEEKAIDDFGNWTQDGIAALGLLAEQMELAQYKAAQYGDAIEQLKQDYSDGRYSEDEYNEKLAELTENQWESIEAYEQAKKEIVSLNKARVDAAKNVIQKEIDAYKELIEAKKESLQADKDAHDFEKQVAEKQKNIANIQKQLSALANNNTPAANAKRKQLQAELLKAQSELDEFYYDKSIEDQQKALDKEQEDYEKNKQDEMDALDAWLEKTDGVISESMNLVKENAPTVLSSIQKVAETYGVKIADAITSPWKSGVNAISDYKNTFDSFINGLNEIKNNQQDMTNEADVLANDVIKDVTSRQDITKDTPKPNPTEPTEPTPKEESVVPTAPSLEIGSSIDVKNGTRWYSDSYGGGDSGIAQGGRIKYINPSGTHPYNIDGSGWVRKEDIVGYAKGTTCVKNSGLYHIDELGDELILHAGPDGRLQYLSKGTGVVPHDLTEKLMDLAIDPTGVLNTSKPSVGAPHITTNNFEVNLEFGSLVHVDNCSQDTVPVLQKMVRTEFDSMMKQLNNRLYGKVR